MKKTLGRTCLLVAAGLLVSAPAIADQVADDPPQQPAEPHPLPEQERPTQQQPAQQPYYQQPAPQQQPTQPQPTQQQPTQQQPTQQQPTSERERYDPAQDRAKTHDKMKMGDKGKLDSALVKKLTASWAAGPRMAVEDLTRRYGDPDEATPSMVIWKDSGPFKRTIVHRDPMQHNFPRPHQGFIEQVVEYRVPVDKFDDLAAYNGSVYAVRTTGELGVTSNDERINVLALNLANDVIEGDASVEQARMQFARTVSQANAGEQPALIHRLQFSPMRNAADPGTSIMDQIEEPPHRGVSQ